MSLRIYLTGRVAIEVDGNVVAAERDLRGKQGRLVFAYLTIERTRAIPRDDLAKIVWPDDMAQSWEVALSALVSRIRKVISIESLQLYRLHIYKGLAQYQMHLPTDVWIDLEAGVSAIDRAEAAVRTGKLENVLGPATVAATIARRSFLSGINGEWADSQRRKLERQLIRALDCLAEMRLFYNEPDLAVESAMESVSLDPYRDSSYQLLMRAHAASGNRAHAIQAYHRLRKSLADDLGTEPSAKTNSLYLTLLD